MLTCYIIDDEAHAIKSLIAHIEKMSLLQLTGYSQDPLKALAEFEEKKSVPGYYFSRH